MLDGGGGVKIGDIFLGSLFMGRGEREVSLIFHANKNENLISPTLTKQMMDERVRPPEAS